MTAVLLLRSTQEKEKVDKYNKTFTEAGLQVQSITPIGFEFFNLDQLYQSVLKPDEFSGVIFSSPRTVSSVKLCIEKNSTLTDWESSGLKAKWASLPAFSVGTSTAGEAQLLGFQTVGDDCGNADNLVKVISQRVQPGHPPLLFPCGTLRRDVIPNYLQENNIAFTACTVYRTCPDEKLEENLKGYLQTNGYPQAVAFFSPSGVQFSKQVLKELQIDTSKKCEYFAIGSTTEKALLDEGLPVAGVSEKPTPESLLICIKNRLQTDAGR